MSGIRALIQVAPQRSLPFHHVQTQQENWDWEEGPDVSVLALLSPTSSLQDCEKCISVVSKSLCLWYVVTGDRTDKDRKPKVTI